ncbi:hypothetical protein [Flavobacterium columnare]|uniref:hypothetical protein n=1 Tax=Flavobacterium columnare TaxID=996 RepID=UPI003B9F1E11
MKKLIKHLSILFLVLVTFTSQAQCWFTNLTTDLANASEQFKSFIKTNDDAFMAYKTIYNARGANAAFRLDVGLLQKVAVLRKDATFMQKIGGDEGLEAIIRNNVRATCKTCNGGAKYLKDMDEYLDDVAYFVNNFYEIRDATRLISELKNGAQNTLEGGAFVVRVFKENPNGLFNVGNVAEIDLRFSEDVLNRFDVKFINGFGEFKSYQINSISNVSANQLKQYLSSPNLNSLNDLNYIFDKRKLLKQYNVGTFDTVDEALIAVKDKMRIVFENNAKSFFEANPNLFDQIQISTNNKIDTWTKLKAVSEDESLFNLLIGNKFIIIR